MSETSKDAVVDALAKLEPRPKPLSEKRSAIEANREAIYAAKDRGCSWVQIAKAFAEVGLVVTPDALRFAINATPRDLKKYPRMTLRRRQKQKVQQAAIETTKLVDEQLHRPPVITSTASRVNRFDGPL
jgi:hypothetical protein